MHGGMQRYARGSIERSLREGREMRPNLFRTGSFSCTDLPPTYKAVYTGFCSMISMAMQMRGIFSGQEISPARNPTNIHHPTFVNLITSSSSPRPS